MNLLSSRPINRRQMLRGLGVTLSLPFLEAMLPSASTRLHWATDPLSKAPRRMLAICNNLGVLPDRFFPNQSGRGYELSTYLQELGEHRSDFTVLSGV